MVNAMFVASLMAKLGISEEEARQVLEDDKRIDRGEKLFELSAEQEKASKQARQADRKPTVYKLDNTNGKRSKKANEVKAGLIELLSEVVKEQPACNSLEIVNNEREFVFSWMGTKYKVVLSAPRS
jgi:hypothetical protein